jgi:glycosyltransferase involved in cell wall biosynthesis
VHTEQHNPDTMQSINPPLVSVVMVICNVDRFLAEAIESIVGQTFDDFEFIILDYGSTDKSKDIVLSYAAKDSRIKLHETPPCTYIEAKIAACSLARGRYIAVQDADDNSLPNRLLWEVEFMEKNPAVGVLGGAADWIDAEGRLLWVFEPPTGNEEIRAALLTRCPFVHSSALMRREAFTWVGGYRRLFAQAEDYDLFLRISEHFQCANLKQVVVQYRIHAHQLSLRTRRQQTVAKLAAQAAASARRTRNMDPLDSVQEIMPSLLLELGVPHARLQAELFFEYRNWIRNMFVAGEYSVALKAAMEMLEFDWEDIDREKIADLWITVAQLFWKQKRFFRCFVAACRAVITKPIIAGDLFGSLLRRVGLA